MQSCIQETLIIEIKLSKIIKEMDFRVRNWVIKNQLASLVAQMVKHLPAMQETWVQSLGWEDPLEKEMQPTPVLLPGKSYGWRSLVGYSPWGRKESDTTEQLHIINTS